MTESNPILKNLRESAGMRLAVLFGSFFILLLISSMVSLGIDNLPGNTRAHILISSVVQCLLAFCLPAFFLARYSSNDWKEWLHLTSPPKIRALVGVIIIYLLSMPAMEWLIEWNNNLHLPASMEALEKTLRGWEEASEVATKTILEAHGFFSILAGIVVIGLITGFSEEIFFRGGLQGIFMQAGEQGDGKGRSFQIGMAVWLSAFIFSAMHFQFFGFIPRLLMGAFFGYLLLWTKSIWVPVFAHALNNSMVVIISSLSENASNSLIDSVPQSEFWSSSQSVILSFVLTAIYLFIFKDNIFKNKNFAWQKSQLPPVSER